VENFGLRDAQRSRYFQTQLRIGRFASVNDPRQDRFRQTQLLGEGTLAALNFADSNFETPIHHAEKAIHNLESMEEES
jgi:hypothetical protein